MCYEPLSVELLALMTPDFNPVPTTPKFSNQIDAAVCDKKFPCFWPGRKMGT